MIQSLVRKLTLAHSANWYKKYLNNSFYLKYFVFTAVRPQKVATGLSFRHNLVTSHVLNYPWLSEHHITDRNAEVT